MLKPADIYRLPYVGNGQISPDGNWVLYTLTSDEEARATGNGAPTENIFHLLHQGKIANQGRSG